MINTDQSEHETSWPPPIQANLPPGPKQRRGFSVGGAATLIGILGPACWAIWAGIYAEWPQAKAHYLFTFMTVMLYTGPALSFGGLCLGVRGGRTRLAWFGLLLCLVGLVGMAGVILDDRHELGHWPQLMPEKEVECGCS